MIVLEGFFKKKLVDNLELGRFSRENRKLVGT
jgi:hypothetical protein